MIRAAHRFAHFLFAILALLASISTAQISPPWIYKYTTARPGDPHVPSVEGAAIANDPVEFMVLFGGLANVVPLNETWVWDGLKWTKLNPATSPSARDGHAFVWDDARTVGVLFGGVAGSQKFNDTWIWNGDWEQKFPVHSPSAMSFHAMAYDEKRAVVVLFGGGDTWTWDGTDWTLITTSVAPAPRVEHAMAYDAKRNVTVLFGGFGGGYLSDTWVWNGTSWSQKKPLTKPPGRWGHMMVYDAAREQVVMFGGMGSNGSDLGDT